MNNTRLDFEGACAWIAQMKSDLMQDFQQSQDELRPDIFNILDNIENIINYAHQEYEDKFIK